MERLPASQSTSTNTHQGHLSIPARSETHPYHGTAGNRCADRRFPRSRSTVGAEVIGSFGSSYAFSRPRLILAEVSMLGTGAHKAGPLPRLVGGRRLVCRRTGGNHVPDGPVRARGSAR